MSLENQLCQWLQADAMRMAALRAARELKLPDWCLAAGFVRNLCWDKLHGNERSHGLNDIDLIYFDPTYATPERDLELERQLHRQLDLPWSVKNQARMHVRNDDPPYVDSADAMSYWVEVETAVGVCLTHDDHLELVAPFGIDSLFAGSLTINPKRPKPNAFQQRIEDKSWLQHWPPLRVIGLPAPTDRLTHPLSILEPEEDKQ